MCQLDKLLSTVLKKNKNIRFEDLCKALEHIGYQKGQPRGGSSHYTFRKKGCYPITIPKQQPMDLAYIKSVAEVVQLFLQENEDD